MKIFASLCSRLMRPPATRPDYGRALSLQSQLNEKVEEELVRLGDRIQLLTDRIKTLEGKAKQ